MSNQETLEELGFFYNEKIILWVYHGTHQSVHVSTEQVRFMKENFRVYLLQLIDQANGKTNDSR